MKPIVNAIGKPTLGATYFGTQGDDLMNVFTNPRAGLRYTDALGGNDAMFGSIYNDGLIGNVGDDSLYGFGGVDVLSGGAGRDVLDGGTGSDYASYQWDRRGVTVDLAITTAQNTQGAGIDRLISIENLIGTRFGDVLFGSDAANIILAEEGNNIVDGRGGADLIYSGRGDDMISGGAGDDTISDAAGSNVIDGGAGQDTLELGDYGPETRIDLAITTAQITTSQAGALAVSIFVNIENIVASGADTVLLGDDRANDLSNSEFNTIFTGLTTPDIGANDVMDGRGGNDRLNGGAGDDVLTGGTGADVFVFHFATSGQSDKITDFNAGEGDRFDLQDVSYGTPLNLSFRASAVFSGTAGEFHVTGPVADQTVSFDLSGDGIADEVIHVASALALVQADFLL